jgi:ParB family chromosome partitioning protein
VTEEQDVSSPIYLQGTNVLEIPLEEICPNPAQPRKVFDDSMIEELAVSIKEVGLIQPVVVRPLEKGYELIVGERRFRAARRAGLEKIPALVQDVDPSEQRLMALVENIHRSDLSSVEEALSLKEILDRTGWNQSELAQKLGRSQSSIANKLRLLRLETPVQEMILSGRLGERQGRALIGLPAEEQVALAEKAVEQEISAKKLEEMSRAILKRLASAENEDTRGRKKTRGGLPFSGPEGPTGDLLKELALVVEGSRNKGVPVLWKVRQIAKNELVVEIKLNLEE